jgi:hypothetical protein
VRGNRNLGEGLVVTEEGDTDSREVMDRDLASNAKANELLGRPRIGRLDLRLKLEMGSVGTVMDHGINATENLDRVLF